nr:ATP-binding protein [Streptomyces sp. CB00455]
MGRLRHRQVPHAHRLGTEAAMKGYRVRYTLATKLVNELVVAPDEKQLNKTMARCGCVDVLCIDELGYMELGRHGAEPRPTLTPIASPAPDRAEEPAKAR